MAKTEQDIRDEVIDDIVKLLRETNKSYHYTQTWIDKILALKTPSTEWVSDADIESIVQGNLHGFDVCQKIALELQVRREESKKVPVVSDEWINQRFTLFGQGITVSINPQQLKHYLSAFKELQLLRKITGQAKS